MNELSSVYVQSLQIGEFEYFGLDFLAKIYLMYKKKYSEEKIPLVKEFIRKYIANEKIDGNEYMKEDIF